MKLDRRIAMRGAGAMAAAAAVCLLFIASYAGALHAPTPHNVPIAVSRDVPAALAARLDASPALKVERVATAADAQRRIDDRKAYGAIVPSGPSALALVIAPAASAQAAQFLRTGVAPQLRRAGAAAIATRTVHPLPSSDPRGLVAFYAVVGWVLAGYFGATLYTLAFGPPNRERGIVDRLVGLLLLAVVVGLAGAGLATGIAGYDHGFLLIALFGALAVLAAGAATVAFQTVLGVAGTGVAILLFVILGNPSAGGPAPPEFLPGFWRAIGWLLPSGAGTTGVGRSAYFPDASLARPLLVLIAWTLLGGVASILLVGRGRPISVEEAEASVAAAAA
jgi:hypothetical protein